MTRPAQSSTRTAQGLARAWCAARPPAQRTSVPLPAGDEAPGARGEAQGQPGEPGDGAANGCEDPQLAPLDLPELRELRRVSQRDEADLSYVRRMLHGRIDILRAELARRTERGAVADVDVDVEMDVVPVADMDMDVDVVADGDGDAEGGEANAESLNAGASAHGGAVEAPVPGLPEARATASAPGVGGAAYETVAADGSGHGSAAGRDGRSEDAEKGPEDTEKGPQGTDERPRGAENGSQGADKGTVRGGRSGETALTVAAAHVAASAHVAGAGAVVERLADILRDGPARHRSSARHLTLGAPLGEESRRLSATMLDEVGLSDLLARTDEELRQAMRRLARHEEEVSRRRQRLQRTADGCSAEIARRYREGEAQVDDLLS